MSEIQKFDEYKSQITRVLTTMFDYLSLEGTFTVEERGQKIGVKIASEDAGRIIGRKGTSGWEKVFRMLPIPSPGEIFSWI